MGKSLVSLGGRSARGAGLLVLVAAALLLGPGPVSNVQAEDPPDALAAQEEQAFREVQLEPGWNLVGFTGDAAPADATVSLDGQFASLWAWDAAAQSFLDFFPGPAGALVSSLSELNLGDGVWINVNAGAGAMWTQPTFNGPRSVSLLPGFNLVMWTGPDDTPIVDAVADLGDALEILFTYDPETDRFLSHSPAAPFLTPPDMALNFGDGVWVRVRAEAVWEQPAGGEAPESTARIDPGMTATLPALPGFEDGAERPLAVAMNEGGVPGYFVENELWLSTSSGVDLNDFLARWDGEVISQVDPGEAGFDLPPQYLVRVNPPAADLDQFLVDLHALDPGSRSDLIVSSEAGLAVMAAGASAALDGMTVGLNWVGSGSDIFSRDTTEAPNGDTISGDAYTPDAFTWPTHSLGSTQDIGVAEAWRALALGNKLGNRVDLAILDMGFQPDADTPPGMVAASNVPFVAAIGTSNLLNCGSPCPWHGTNVASAAMAVVDNSFGAAGPAGQIARPILVFTLYDMFTGIGALTQAAILGADIANMSYGAPVPAALSWSVIPFNLATRAARASGMLLFAAAGNDGRNVDAEDCFVICWEETWWTPCENGGVICVGGLAWDSKNRASGSNYGAREVDIFAPYTMWLGPDPSATANRARVKNGTSFSSPFAAGVAAMIWAARPDFSASDVEDALFRTAHSSPDSRVNRYVNAFGAVQEAMSDVPPFIEIQIPAQGASYTQGTSVLFSAFAEDFEDGTPTVRWTSSLDGVIGSGVAFTRIDLTVGVHTITATATDSRGQSSSDTITFELTAATPVMTIISPTAGATFCNDEAITLLGSSFFAAQTPIGPLPESQVSWSSSIAGPLGTGHTRSVTLANGTHVITFTGTPTVGLPASASRTITVQTCSDTPPVVTITTPPNDVTTQLNEYAYDGYDMARMQWYKDVLLQGTATDAEDGALTGASLVWTTNLSSVQTPLLGTGTSLTVRLYSSNCTGSLHTITLSATDSDMNTRTAVRQILIWTVC